MELGLPGQIEQEMCINFAHRSVSPQRIESKLTNRTNQPLYLQTEFEAI